MRGARRIHRGLSAVIALLLVAGCSAAAAGSDDAPAGKLLAAASAPTTAAPSTTVAPAPPPAPTAAPVTAPPTTAPPAPKNIVPLRTRTVVEQPWLPFAAVQEVVLHHPSAQVEKVGFHESNHDGAQAMTPLPTAVDPTVLESRERDTARTGAADVVAHPEIEVRAPVTGTVKRGGRYVLYCDHYDYYVVIEPDAHPGWEVKVLHIAGLYVKKGERVTAGETVLAPYPTQLPFESQVDETTGQPAWPHVHIEVVDPTVKDRPTPGGGC